MVCLLLMLGYATALAPEPLSPVSNTTRSLLYAVVGNASTTVLTFHNPKETGIHDVDEQKGRVIMIYTKTSYASYLPCDYGRNSRSTLTKNSHTCSNKYVRIGSPTVIMYE